MRNMITLGVSVLLLSVAAALSSAGVPPSSPVDVESSGREASSEVQAMLAEVPHLIEIWRFAEGLAKSDEALELAQKTNDRPGIALAQRSRAGALLWLKRFSDAEAAWREATEIWTELGDGPRQIEGLASTGVALLALNSESTDGRELLERALALADEEEARDPLATAQALHDAGLNALDSKQRENAIRLLSASVEILEQHAPESVALAESLMELAHAQIGNDEGPALARGSLDHALDIVERVAPQSADHAKCLGLFGLVDEEQQNFAEALEPLIQALTILDNVDPEGYHTTRLLLDAAYCEVYLGKFDDARRHALRALAIREALSAGPSELAVCVNILGSVEHYSDNPDAARPYFERVVAIREASGDDPVKLAEALINLGNVMLAQWDFAAARDHYERALALLEEHAPTHNAVGKALGNLREMSFRQFDVDAAASYSEKEVAFFQEYYPDSLELSIAFTGAGIIALERGDPVAAKAYHSRALTIRERIAPDTDWVSESMLFTAAARMELGELDEAERLLREGLGILGGEVATGGVAVQTVFNLGEVAYRRGDFAQAEVLQRRALLLLQNEGVPEGPTIAFPLFSLAKALQGLGRSAEALDAALGSESLRLRYLRTSARLLSEREALAFGALHLEALDVVMTVASDVARRIPDSGQRAFDAVIRSRAAVLDEVASRNRGIWGASDPKVAQLAGDYAKARDGLARLAVEGSGDDPEAYQQQLEEARTAKDRAERGLAAASSEFRRDLAREQAGFDEVAGRLSSEGALVAYVRFERITPPTARQQTASASQEKRFEYAAFVLPEGAAEPVMVPLGSAEEIDALVAELRRQIASALVPGPGTGKRATDQYRSVGGRLRERVWDPVARQLGESSRVFVVPDGALNLVELAALPVGDSQYLVEAGPRIHYLSAERDVLAFEESPAGGGLLALGDPAFDEPTLFAALAPGGTPVKVDEAYRVASAGTYRGLRSSCGSFASMHFEPLPETGGEVDEVAGVWRKQARRNPEQAKPDDVMSLRGAAASEAAFKNLASGARVVHLATHGFFLGEGCPSAAEGSRSPATGEVIPAIRGESPLLLSGFALAGANRRDAAGAEEEDGILTAEEIAALNLTKVQWAVLSGCDTGVGEVRVGEGVFGLRRAFQVAGARTLVMSLWPVEDETTRKWMKALYENRFAKGMSTIDAVHEANLTVLRQRREAGLSTHPAHWAGFIASGDWH